MIPSIPVRRRFGGREPVEPSWVGPGGLVPEAAAAARAKRGRGPSRRRDEPARPPRVDPTDPRPYNPPMPHSHTAHSRTGHGSRPVLFLTVFIHLLGFGIIIPLLPYYAETYGASGLTVGL